MRPGPCPRVLGCVRAAPLKFLDRVTPRPASALEFRGGIWVRVAGVGEPSAGTGARGGGVPGEELGAACGGRRAGTMQPAGAVRGAAGAATFRAD